MRARERLAPLPTSFDVLIVGSGVAGLSVAARLGRIAGLRTALVTKSDLSSSATRWAQGGVAAVLSPDGSVPSGPEAATLPPAADPGFAAPADLSMPSDSTELHLSDTLAAGGGLCDLEAARVLVEEGPVRVRELLSLGAVFDRDPAGELERAREGGHSRARVLHAGGVATGAEIERALVASVRDSRVTILEGWFALDILVDSDRCAGVRVMDPAWSAHEIRARHVLLATGGAGQLYSVTTNPLESTGDGLAIALRAGVPVADIELVQFHPTALHHPAMPRLLLSEALRGHGALLRDTRGERFVDELAPRDVVSRAIALRMREQAVEHLWLDATGLKEFATRFPTLSELLASAGFDPAAEWLPVVPAAHHMSGGVLTDLDGATALPGLWAVGEVACTGAHGANRLASNSLLEGMVFAARAVTAIEDGRDGPRATGAMKGVLGEALAGCGEHQHVPAMVISDVMPGPLIIDPAEAVDRMRSPEQGEKEIAVLRQSLQVTMATSAGVLRDASHLEAAQEILSEMPCGIPTGIASAELANLVTAARALITSALCRQESRGAHYRQDFPFEDERWLCRLVQGACGLAGDLGSPRALPRSEPRRQPVPGEAPK